MKRERFRFYAIKMVGIMIAVFVLQLALTGFTDLFILNGLSWTQWWRFVTAMFLHGGIAHLAYNSFALLLFGSILERLIGGRKFLTVFFVTGILANLFSLPFYDASLGASGAIFGVIGALIFIRPLLPVWAFGMPLPIIVAGVFWAVGDVLGAIGFLTGNPIDNTGNLAHLSGMVFGLILGWVYRSGAKKKKRRVKYVLDERSVREWEDGYLR